MLEVGFALGEIVRQGGAYGRNAAGQKRPPEPDDVVPVVVEV